MPFPVNDMPVLLQINLEGITAAALDSFEADIWLMSPPCQPFTRRGLQLHAADRRSASFVHLLETLPSLKVTLCIAVGSLWRRLCNGLNFL